MKTKRPRLTWRRERREVGDFTGKMALRLNGEVVAHAQELRRGGWFSYAYSNALPYWNTCGLPTELDEAKAHAEAMVRSYHPAFKEWP